MKTLKQQGCSQREIYQLFIDQQIALSGEEPNYDALADVLDLIVSGPWAKGKGLFETELREDD